MFRQTPSVCPRGTTHPHIDTDHTRNGTDLHTGIWTPSPPQRPRAAPSSAPQKMPVPIADYFPAQSLMSFCVQFRTKMPAPIPRARPTPISKGTFPGTCSSCVPWWGPPIPRLPPLRTGEFLVARTIAAAPFRIMLPGTHDFRPTGNQTSLNIGRIAANAKNSNPPMRRFSPSHHADHDHCALSTWHSSYV